MSDLSCPFCSPNADRVFAASPRVLALWDRYPVSPGHALLIPRRHVASWFDATREEQSELLEAIATARSIVLDRHRDPAPEGFNIGVNVGEAAGQTVFHLHVHVIPRYRGDMADPRGGVRHVIPAKANYLTGSKSGASIVGDRESEAALQTSLFRGAPHRDALIRGDGDPLLPHLVAHLAHADHVDLAVAFILESGVRRIETHLGDLFGRGGRARVLTGDYLDVTDPNALLRLLDLAEAHPGSLELRVFEAADQSFHPKAFIFLDSSRDGLAYVGSSNLTETALTTGVEWNYRAVPSHDRAGFEQIRSAFESLFAHAKTQAIDADWIRRYRARRRPPTGQTVEIAPEPALPPPEPHVIQREALDALEASRAQGNAAGLVVMATGLGKTWLAAFDSAKKEFRRVLFVAHREEILAQAMNTFRRIRPDAYLGFYSGQEKAPDADVLFASIQTLGRTAHLQLFAPKTFDYIVVDEFHHASSRTYRRLIDHFDPRFLLGLTATPERTDGGDLLSLCQENLVYRCDLLRAIQLGLLSPFHYFGVPDEVDYRNIPWRSSRFDEEALTDQLATQSRAQNALEQWRLHGGSRTIAFCCSKRHADFMSAFFSRAGVRTVAVHSGDASAPRADSLEKLERGEIEVIFAVDMFNEGVDLPRVDTILMLRPTESRIIWLQQFGRGLRRADGKSHVTVVDYIGNHRTFLLKPQTLFGLGADHREIARTLEQLEAGTAELPPGCEVAYDLRVIDILRSLLRLPRDEQALRSYYEDFRERSGERPRALEAYHDGYHPRSARKMHGSWLRFVATMGDLAEKQLATLDRAGDFLDQIEVTPMTKSFKMLVLLAMLNEDAIPGQIELDRLVESFARLARRSAIVREELGVDVADRTALRRTVVKNPIEALVGGKGTGGVRFFRLEGERFGTTFSIPKELRAPFQELTREIVDWRLAEYLDRPAARSAADSRIVCKVSHANRRPILFLPNREIQSGIPSGWTDIWIDDEPHQANFAKVAINVVRKNENEANVLPAVLRRWFGPDAGLPGTDFQVALEPIEGGYRMVPVRRRGNSNEALDDA